MVQVTEVQVGQTAVLDECGHQRVTMKRNDVPGRVILRVACGTQVEFALTATVEAAEVVEVAA